jgi:hypothetical protein
MNEPVATAVSGDIGQGFRVEWDACHAAAKARVVTRLEAMSCSPAMIAHVSQLRLYYRAAFLLSVWAQDIDARRELSSALACHIVGMKLLDDLVDQDSGVDRFELGGGALTLLLAAAAQFQGFAGSADIARTLDDNFLRICRTQLKCKQTAARTLEQWLGYAEDYGSRFLATYGRVGGLAAGLNHEQATVPERFASAFGMIITISDDLTDYFRHDERDGNIGALLVDGAVTRERVEGELRSQRQKAIDAATALPTAHDLLPVIEVYTSDAITRILAQFAET